MSMPNGPTETKPGNALPRAHPHLWRLYGGACPGISEEGARAGRGRRYTDNRDVR